MTFYSQYFSIKQLVNCPANNVLLISKKFQFLRIQASLKGPTFFEMSQNIFGDSYHTF